MHSYDISCLYLTVSATDLFEMPFKNMFSLNCIKSGKAELTVHVIHIDRITVLESFIIDDMKYYIVQMKDFI